MKRDMQILCEFLITGLFAKSTFALQCSNKWLSLQLNK